jgi:hypothetical protein
MVLMLLVGAHHGLARDGGLPVMAQALANAPRVLEPHLSRAEASWSVTFTAEFANSCLADQGMALRYLDVAAAGSRLLLGEQQPPPDGCPEIYRPVRRSQRFVMPVSADVQELIWLDLVDGQQPYRMRVTDADAGAVSGQALNAQAIAAIVPMVERAELVGGTAPAVSFEVPLAATCAEAALRLVLLDGRSAVEGRNVEHAVAWLLLLADAPACGDGDGLTTRVLQARLPELAPGREIRLVNPTRHGGSGEARMFARIPLADGP